MTALRDLLQATAVTGFDRHGLSWTVTEDSDQVVVAAATDATFATPADALKASEHLRSAIHAVGYVDSIFDDEPARQRLSVMSEYDADTAAVVWRGVVELRIQPIT